jgi:hypothetical protein
MSVDSPHMGAALQQGPLWPQAAVLECPVPAQLYRLAAEPLPSHQARGLETRGLETRGLETRGLETRGLETRGLETRGLGKEIVTRQVCLSTLHRKTILCAVLLGGLWLSAHDDGHSPIREPPGAGGREAGPCLRRSVASRTVGSAGVASAFPRCRICGHNLLAQEPEIREPVFRKDHVQTKR